MSIETERRWKEWMEQQSRVLQDAASAASAAGVELSPVSLEAATARSPEEVLRIEALLAKEIAEKAMRRSDALTAKAHTLACRAQERYRAEQADDPEPPSTRAEAIAAKARALAEQCERLAVVPATVVDRVSTPRRRLNPWA